MGIDKGVQRPADYMPLSNTSVSVGDADTFGWFKVDLPRVPGKDADCRSEYSSCTSWSFSDDLRLLCIGEKGLETIRFLSGDREDILNALYGMNVNDKLY